MILLDHGHLPRHYGGCSRLTVAPFCSVGNRLAYSTQFMQITLRKRITLPRFHYRVINRNK